VACPVTLQPNVADHADPPFDRLALHSPPRSQTAADPSFPAHFASDEPSL
jgi:hypothetical protein